MRYFISMIVVQLLAIFVTILLLSSIYVVCNAYELSRNQYIYIPKEIKTVEASHIDLDNDIVEFYKKRHKNEDYEEAKYVCNMFGLEREPWDEFDELQEISYKSYKEGIKC